MTFIDPFAPASSPQHPANFHHPKRVLAAAPVEDVAPPWIALPGEPVSPDIPEHEANAILDARWGEHEDLILRRAPEHTQTLDRPVTEWPDDMPTLLALRAMPDPQEQADPTAEAEGEQVADDTEEDASEDDLQAQLERDLAALRDVQ